MRSWYGVVPVLRKRKYIVFTERVSRAEKSSPEPATVSSARDSVSVSTKLLCFLISLYKQPYIQLGIGFNDNLWTVHLAVAEISSIFTQFSTSEQVTVTNDPRRGSNRFKQDRSVSSKECLTASITSSSTIKKLMLILEIPENSHQGRLPTSLTNTRLALGLSCAAR